LVIAKQGFRLKAEVGFYDLGFKQRCILVAQEAQTLNAFSLSTGVVTFSFVVRENL
jgi:hypothetical protein